MPADEQQVTTGLDAFRERVANYLVQLLRSPSDGALIADLIGNEAGILLTQGDEGYWRYLNSVRLVEFAALGIDLDDLDAECAGRATSKTAGRSESPQVAPPTGRPTPLGSEPRGHGGSN